MSPAWADILLLLSFAAIATLISGLIFSLRRDTPSPRQFGWLIMALVAVLAVQVIVTVTLFVAPSPAAILVPAETASSGDHQAILNAIRDLRVPVVQDPEPPVVTSRGWVVFTLLAVLGIAIVIFGPRLLRRLFPSSEALPTATTAAGSLLTLPLALSGSITLVDQLHLVDNFAFLKVEIGQPSDLDEHALAVALGKELERRWNDGLGGKLTGTVGEMVTAAKQEIVLRIDDTHKAPAEPDLASPQSETLEKPKPQNHQPGKVLAELLQMGDADCGTGRTMIVAGFPSNVSDRLDEADLPARVKEIAGLLNVPKKNSYLAAVLVIGSADRRPRKETNDLLAIRRADKVASELKGKVGSGTIDPINISKIVPSLRVSLYDGRDLERAVQVCGLWLDRKESAELAGTAPTQP